MLPDWILGLRTSHNIPVEVDRTHRIFFSNTSRPQTRIFNLLRYINQQDILEGVRKAEPALPDDGTRLQLFTDYSPGTTQERQGCKEISAKPRQKGINSFLVYPAILRVNHKCKRMSFHSAEEARETQSHWCWEIWRTIPSKIHKQYWSRWSNPKLSD